MTNTRGTLVCTADPSCERGEAQFWARFTRVLDAFRAGQSSDGGPPSADPTRVQAADEESKASVLRRLSVSDRVVMRKLDRVREGALVLARRDEREEAAAQMRTARYLFAISTLSLNGRIWGRTMLCAAESYLSYRCGSYADARAQMASALQATDDLIVAWNNCAALAARRAHLENNLMRVEIARGAWEAAMELGVKTIEQLGTTPLHNSPSAVADESRLNVVLARHLSDSVMTAVAELVVRCPGDRTNDLLRSLARECVDNASCSARAAAWLRVKLTAREDKPDLHLAAAESFLRAGRDEAPVLWYDVAAELARVWSGIHPVAAEIAAQLMADPRSPKWLRLVGTVPQLSAG